MLQFARLLLLSMLGLLVVACSINSPKKAYTGKEQPLSELSVLSCSFGTAFVAIDGNKEFSGAPFKCNYAVKPGKHQVTMKFYKNAKAGGRWVYPEPRTIEFTTKKGYKYSTWAHIKDGAWDIKVWEWPQIKDKSSKSTKKAKSDNDGIDFKVIK